MKSLIPVIEIGRRYRIRIRPQEGVVCPNCGREAGKGWIGEEYVVTILEPYRLGLVVCRICKTLIVVSTEGRYACLFQDGTEYVIPYTDFLEEVE